MHGRFHAAYLDACAAATSDAAVAVGAGGSSSSEASVLKKIFQDEWEEACPDVAIVFPFSKIPALPRRADVDWPDEPPPPEEEPREAEQLPAARPAAPQRPPPPRRPVYDDARLPRFTADPTLITHGCLLPCGAVPVFALLVTEDLQIDEDEKARDKALSMRPLAALFAQQAEVASIMLLRA